MKYEPLFKQIKMEIIDKLRENFCLAFFKNSPAYALHY